MIKEQFLKLVIIIEVKIENIMFYSQMVVLKRLLMLNLKREEGSIERILMLS